MNMCPGQDTRFWTPDDVFEIPCQACGRPVEFFKTDAKRRCPGCGKRVQNPKVSTGCAQWCDHAKQCLGFDPKDIELADTGELSLIDQLVEALKRVFDDQELATHSMLVLDRAQELMRQEGGDPRVVMAASLLHDIGIPAAEEKHGTSDAPYHEVEGAAVARGILEEAGLDEDTVDHVCRIVRSHHSDDDTDSPEFRIVWDADRLEEIPEGLSKLGPDRLDDVIGRVFKTDTGRQRARKLYAKAQTA